MIKTWQNLLDEYKIQYVLLEVNGDSELIYNMRQQAKWIVKSEDETAVLFTRSE